MRVSPTSLLIKMYAGLYFKKSDSKKKSVRKNYKRKSVRLSSSGSKKKMRIVRSKLKLIRSERKREEKKRESRRKSVNRKKNWRRRKRGRKNKQQSKKD
jgi:hypothetical protein